MSYEALMAKMMYSPLDQEREVEMPPPSVVRELPERTPDGHPQVWLLYRPEPHTSDGVWVRKCDVFTSREAAIRHLTGLIGHAHAQTIRWEPHVLFPELSIGTDGRGHCWYLEPAPLLGATREQLR